MGAVAESATRKLILAQTKGVSCVEIGAQLSHGRPSSQASSRSSANPLVRCHDGRKGALSGATHRAAHEDRYDSLTE